MTQAVVPPQTLERQQTVSWTPEQTERFWDFEQSAPANFCSVQVGERLARRMAPLLRGKRVLDFGCGTGHLLHHLLLYVGEAWGCDVSVGCRNATSRLLAGEARFLGAYGPEELLERELRFDVVVCSEVLEHLKDEQLASAMSTIRHLLSRPGILIVTTPNSEELTQNFVRCPECGSVFHRWQHVRSWTGETLRSMLQDSGFSVRQVSPISPAYRPNAIGQFALWLLERYTKQSLRPMLYGVGEIN